MKTLEAPLQFVEMDMSKSKMSDDNLIERLEENYPDDERISVAHAISTQPWETIGKKPIIVGGIRVNKEDDHEDLINQIVAILEMRLTSLLSSRTAVMGVLVNTRAAQGELTDVLTPAVRQELRAYVCQIASLYRRVHYHAFPHAAHVTLSVNRLVQMMLDSKDGNEGSSSTATTEEMSTDSAGGERSDKGARRRSITRRITLQHVYFSPDSTPEEKPKEGETNPGRNTKQVLLSSKAISVRGSLADVITELDYEDDGNDGERNIEKTKPKAHSSAALFNRTFGLSLDPLSHFASVFSALVHDVEHQGVPNSTLVQEGDELAFRYNNKSVAEQNSLAVALGILRGPDFKNLKGAIMPTPEASLTFSEKVIDIILATDISSKERAQILKSKWIEAFDSPEKTVVVLESEEDELFLGGYHSCPEQQQERHRRHSICTSGTTKVVRVDLQKAIAAQAFHLNGQPCDMLSAGSMLLKSEAVLETLMIVADVAHTMQDFDVFVKWNKCLFRELLSAFKCKRISFDPSGGWYENQIGFYKGYIIPLADKLRQCGVFGDKGSLFVDCAKANLELWTKYGKGISKTMVGEIREEMGFPPI